MKNVYVGLIFLLVSLTGQAQSIVWHGQNDFLTIGDKVAYLEDKQGDLTIDQVSSAPFNQRFIPSKQVILNFGYTESIYWLTFSFENRTGQNLLLEIAHAVLPITELYYKDDRGQMVKLEAGYNIPLNEKIIKHHFQVFPLPAGKHTFYVRLLSNSHPLPVRIWEASAHDIRTYRQRMIYGFYLGLMSFVLLSNLFFFLSLRNRMYLFYAVVVFIYMCYAVSVMDGFIVYFFPHVDVMFWYITIPTIGVTVQTTYCLLFLEASKYVPKLTRITWAVIAYFTVYMVFKYALPLTAILAINTINALISFFMMGLIGFKVGRRGNKLGYYYALAYMIYFMLVLTEATYIQTGKPAYIAELSHVTLATLFEAFILSFLLSKRFEWEKEDIEKARREAQQKLVETTLEKERIVSQQNHLLEQQVVERTLELSQTNEILHQQKEEIEAQRDNLEQTLNDLKAAQDQLIQKEKMASLGELTAGIAHEIQNPLNFVNNFAEVSVELAEELEEDIKAGEATTAVALSVDLRHNMTYISQHGQRASAIVRAMLEHSRTRSGEPQPTDLNKLASEYLRLVYHGLKAKNKSFSANFTMTPDPQLELVAIVPQDISRVLLNLYNNAFYAVQEKAKQVGPDYLPHVWVSTQAKGNTVELCVRDNGVGIPPQFLDKIFQPFFTTKPSGQGTGLGLSLGYDIITKGYGGDMRVQTELGVGTEFIITLPIRR